MMAACAAAMATAASDKEVGQQSHTAEEQHMQWPHAIETVQDVSTQAAANLQRAMELQRRAQQLAYDEAQLMNQAIRLHLMARNVAEDTMRPPKAPLALQQQQQRVTTGGPSQCCCMLFIAMLYSPCAPHQQEGGPLPVYIVEMSTNLTTLWWHPFAVYTGIAGDGTAVTLPATHMPHRSLEGMLAAATAAAASPGFAGGKLTVEEAVAAAALSSIPHGSAPSAQALASAAGQQAAGRAAAAAAGDGGTPEAADAMEEDVVCEVQASPQRAAMQRHPQPQATGGASLLQEVGCAHSPTSQARLLALSQQRQQQQQGMAPEGGLASSEGQWPAAPDVTAC